MADPISITGIVVTIGGLIKLLYDYGKAIDDAQQDIVSLCGELSALKSVLLDFESGCEGQVAPFVSERLIGTQTLVDDLCSKLTPRTRTRERVFQSLKWPFNETQVQRTLGEVERLKTWFMLRMMTDTHSGSRNIQTGLEKLTSVIQGDISQRTFGLKAQETEAIRRLLAPVSPIVTQRKSCETWVDTPSGSWLLEGEFKSWLESVDPLKRVLILTGPSGSGKTILMSQAVEQARKHISKDLTTRLGYFYCSYSSSASLKLRNILGSWLVQISNNDSILAEQYKPCLNDFTEVKTEQIEQSIADSGGTLLLFLDAINESTEMDRISSCIQRLSSTSNQTVIKCFITTTPMFHSRFDHTRINMQAHRITPDIETYVRRRIAQYQILQSIPEANILGTLIGGANGMFRWVDCQISILAAQRTPKLVLKALENLPGTLNDTYARILNRLPVVDQEIVHEALLWLCYAFRPLTLDELCEAVVYETGDHTIDDTCRLKPLHQLIELCKGLVVLDEISNTVTLAHSSVRDFLTGQEIVRSACNAFALDEFSSQRNILRKSLSYLSIDAIRRWKDVQQPISWWFKRYPLLNYVSKNWCHHARRCQSKLSESDLELVGSFLFTHQESLAKSVFTFWIQCLLSTDEIYRNPDGLEHREIVEAAEPLYYTASFSFEVYIERMFAQRLVCKTSSSGPWCLHHKCGGAFSTALQVACWRGSTRTVKMILNEGADPNSTNFVGLSCLGAARVRGRIDVIDELIKHGAKLNNVDQRQFGLFNESGRASIKYRTSHERSTELSETD